jgi:6-pyruvoyltetrahydropterin/6-carboxytetrahydropterin synthase
MSWSVCKDFRFAAAHQIRGHRGGCENLHGHSYRVRVWVQASTRDALGMVIDFADLKRALEEVVGPFDHRFLNEVPPFDQRNTTAELLAEHLCHELARRVDDGRVRVTAVEVWEGDGAGAVYSREATE